MSNFSIIIVAVFALFFIYQHIRNGKSVAENTQLGADFLAENAQKEGVESTASGLQYKVLTKGDGVAHPTAKSKVTVHYQGTLIDGTVFDTTINRDKPISFALNRVIKGWIEGVQLMSEGDKFRFYVPSDLAYGKRKIRKIPAGSLLIFDIELISIN